MDLHAVVTADGHGWLVIDTADWLTTKLGGPDVELTADLAAWIDLYEPVPAGCGAPARWADWRLEQVGGSEPGDPPAAFNSANERSLLSEDICVTIMRVHDGGTPMTLAVVDHREVYVPDPARPWSDVVDWCRASGGCVKGHTFTVERGSYLHSRQDMATYRLADLCRADDYGDGGYVACPDCGHFIWFTA